MLWERLLESPDDRLADMVLAGTTATNPATIASYQLTGLQGQDTARTIQFEFRFNW